MNKYIVTKTHKGVKKGSKVYKSHAVGYSLASEDTRFTGREHILVNEVSPYHDQTYNNFTFPLDYLELIEETDEEVLNIIKKKEMKIKRKANKNLEKISQQLLVMPVIVINKGRHLVYELSAHTHIKLISNIRNNEQLLYIISKFNKVELISLRLFHNVKNTGYSLSGPTMDVSAGFELYFNHASEDWGHVDLRVEMEPDDIKILRITKED